MAELDGNNEIFKLAADLVNQSNRNIFLTGKAGTGKTTFLKYIRTHSVKNTAVVAPTGVAAINAGGATIHSFFLLPFSPFLPESSGTMDQHDANNKHTLFGKIKLNRDRINVIRQLELLIIDEISMVRCDLLDAIDAVLRHFRSRHAEPFGGVQLLLIGDMHQLPPVSVDREWNLLSNFYPSPYFFDSRIMQHAPPAFIEFEKIYRQSDDLLIDLLNQVRNNDLSDHGRKLLDQLFKPDFRPEQHEGFITLTTHNYKADTLNTEALSRLGTKSYTFKATIEGSFNEKSYPADELLQLKEGAQVMFIKNDKERIKRYYNGRIGTITRITDEGIFVQCRDERDEIEVQKETWENIRYTINKSTNQLEDEVIGSFTQYPLRLAWAITIHKSQGLTFEKAVIDAGDAFAAGQVYVALSRCTSLDGIVLQSRITLSSLRSDETIVRFSQNIATANRLKDELVEAKKRYQQEILLTVFSFLSILRACSDLKQFIQSNQKEFTEGSLSWLEKMEEKLTHIQSIADKFKGHLQSFFSEDQIPEENIALQNRIKNASVYFTNELEDILQFMTASPVITDSKLQAKQFNDTLKDLYTAVAEKKHIVQGFDSGFCIDDYFRQKKAFVVPSFTVNAYATAAEEKRATPHPKLHFQLRELRNKICEQKNAPVFMVASGKSIDEMVLFLPQTTEDLLKITGFGKAKVDQYGKQFLDIIVLFCRENGLSSMMPEITSSKKKKASKADKKQKVDTKSQTYELFRQGKSVEQIAEERKLTNQTIETHLCFYVSKGMIDVAELLQEEKLQLIEPHILDRTDKGIISIKQQLGERVSFGEIRLAMAAKEWEKSKEPYLRSPVSGEAKGIQQ